MKNSGPHGRRDGEPPFPAELDRALDAHLAGAAGAGSGIAVAQVAQKSAPVEAPAKGHGRAMAAMGLSQSIDSSQGGVVGTFFPLIGAAFGVGESALGVLSSMSKFARMIFGPFWAMLADRYGRKRVLVMVIGIGGLWTVASGFSPNFTWLLILYGISVIGTVASEPIINGLLPDLFKQSQRGRAFGTLRAVGTFVGVILGPAIGLFARGEDPSPDAWRYALWAMGAVSLLSAGLVALWLRDPKAHSAVADMKIQTGQFKVSDVVRLFKIPTFSLMAGMVVMVTVLVMFAFYPNFLVTERGLTVFDATLAMSGFSLGAVGSSYLGGRLGDFFATRWGESGRVTLMQLYLVGFAAVVAIATQIPYQGLTSALVFSILLGLVFPIGFAGCVLPMISNVVPRQLNATAFAVLFSFVQGGISALMTLGLGFVAEAFSSQSVFLWFVVVPYLLNAVYWFQFYRVYPKDVERQQERTDLVEAGRF